MTIDPNLGGCSLVEGGHPASVLAAGYIGSTAFGGAFVLAGWDTLVAKIMSFVLGVGLICPLALARDKLCVPALGLRRDDRADVGGRGQDDIVDGVLRGAAHWILVRGPRVSGIGPASESPER